jgi:drug/metabolite transporter (DMT)-like permease
LRFSTRHTWVILSARRLLLHVSRNTFHFGGQFLWATAVTLLPLASVFALEFTAPAHTALLFAAFLRECLTPGRIGVVILGFLGVLIILRPGLDSFEPAACLPLAAAFAFAVVLTQTKALTATETSFAILLWMNIVQLQLSLLGSNPWSYHALGTADLLPVGAVALTDFTSQFCLFQAFRHGDATVVVTLDFMRILRTMPYKKAESSITVVQSPDRVDPVGIFQPIYQSP